MKRTFEITHADSLGPEWLHADAVLACLYEGLHLDRDGLSVAVKDLSEETKTDGSPESHIRRGETASAAELRIGVREGLIRRKQQLQSIVDDELGLVQTAIQDLDAHPELEQFVDSLLKTGGVRLMFQSW